MIDLQTILITCLPSATSILAIIAATAPILKVFNSLRKEVASKVENEALKNELRATVREVKQLKKVYQLAIEKQAKVCYQDLTEVKKDEDLQ